MATNWAIIPSADVQVEDICQTLASNGAGLEGDTGVPAGKGLDESYLHTYFSPYCNISKWSKRKPVAYPQAAALTDAQFKKVNYGIVNTPYWTRVASMASGFVDGTVDAANKELTPYDWWDYRLPQGGVKEPLRLSDFCGYAPQKSAPAGQCGADLTITSEGLLVVQFAFLPSSDTLVGLSDLGVLASVDDTALYKAFDTMYAGLCLYNGSTAYYITSGTMAGTDELGLAFRIYDAPSALAGSWTAFVFASSEEIPSLVTTLSTYGVYAPVPMTKTSVTITKASIGVTLTAYYCINSDSSTRLMDYRYAFYNADDTKYFTDSFVTVEVLDSSNNVIVSNETAAVTIAASGRTEVTGSVDLGGAAKRAMAAVFRVSCKINGTAYSAACATGVMRYNGPIK